jgi:integrase
MVRAGTVGGRAGVTRPAGSAPEASPARWTRSGSCWVWRTPSSGRQRVRLPRIIRPEMHFLTAAQVEQLAAAITVPCPLLVRFDAYTGLRPGELAAIRVGRLDLLRGTCEVVESATEVDNKLVWA